MAKKGVRVFGEVGLEVDNDIVNSSNPLPVFIASGGSSGAQYTEGDTDASITGTAAMMEGAGNTLLPIQGTIADGLLVNLGSNNDVTVTGSVTADTELPAAAALADSTANPTVPGVGSFSEVYDDNAATWSRQKSIRHGLNSLGTGIAASGTMIEFDDTSPTSVTENQFAPLRGSSRREAYMQIRDAAGGERGANVTVGGALQTDGSATTQPISAASLPLPSGAATSAKQDTIIGHIDGVETLLTAIDGHVDGIEGSVDGIEALLTSIDGDMDTLIGHVDGVETLLGTSNTNTGAAATSLAVIDDWDESDRAKVNPIAGQAGVQGASGVVTALTQRVVLATDVALPAGTNAIGKLAANSGVDIGDVDITSFPPNSETTGTISALDGTVEHTIPQFSHSSGLIVIDGTYVGILTVEVDGGDGNWNGYRGLNGQDFVSSLGSGEEGFLFLPMANFAKLRLRMTSYSSGSVSIRIRTSPAAGTLFLAHPIPTGANVIGGVFGDIAHDAADSGKPLKVGRYASTANRTRVASGDRVDSLADTAGRDVAVLYQVRELTEDTTVTLTGNSETTLIAAVASTFNDLVELTCTNTGAAAITLTLRSTTGGATRRLIRVPINNTIQIVFPATLKQTTVNTNWTVQSSSASGDSSIGVSYVANI